MGKVATIKARIWIRVGVLAFAFAFAFGGAPLAQASEPSKPKPKADATAAPAAASGEESLDVLRQRLAERLSNKSDTPAPALKVSNSGSGHDEAAKPAKASKGVKKAEPPAHAAAAHAHWGYVGDGAPERWAELSPENAQCGIGTRQSPIDIREGIRVDLEKINFDYRPSNFSVLDNGHTIQLNVAPGNALQVMGRRFELLQFHFHRPSEERINGRQYDMDAHLVHKDADGKLGVVAVLLERGRDQALIQTIWNNLPLEKGQALAAPGLLDLNQLLPEDRSYFTYMGSLTTPPCSEGVLWMVMRTPVQLSANQIAIFARLYPMNARPIQSGSGRLIKESSGGP